SKSRGRGRVLLRLAEEQVPPVREGVQALVCVERKVLGRASPRLGMPWLRGEGGGVLKERDSRPGSRAPRRASIRTAQALDRQGCLEVPEVRREGAQGAIRSGLLAQCRGVALRFF